MRDLVLDAGIELAGEGPQTLAASVWWPSDPDRAPAVLVCLAGGNMNRRYYDLRPETSDLSFSFAGQMTSRGFIVITIDHLGLGGSTRPADGYALTPERIVSANARATAELLSRLREGRLDPDLPALPRLRSVGVGHSMGAMLTVMQQAETRPHDALVLLGFSTRGLPQFLPPKVRELAVADPAALRAGLVDFARGIFVEPYPLIRSSGGGNAEFYGSAKADPRGVAALKAATDALLPVPAFLSMVPGNVATEAARIDVPLFLGLGERDMAGAPHDAPAAFSACRDLSLYVLPETGHSHFLFPSRTALFDRIAYWAKGLSG